MGDAPPLLFLEDAFGLPTGQSFVHHGDGDADLFAEAVGKARGFFGHIAVRAVEAEGQTDNDLLDVVLANEFAETAHIFVAIDAFEGVVGRRDAGFGVSQGEANARTAVVERQDLALFLRGYWPRRPLFLVKFASQFSIA